MEVVSDRPGTWGSINDGRTEISETIGIWRETASLLLSSTWAILLWDMSL
jgi:hypothetical protein